MILSNIKEYFSEHPVVSLSDLSIRFDVEPEAMRGMLNHWIIKGKLRKVDHSSSCSNCCSDCKSEHLEIYEWTDNRSGTC